MKKELGIMLKNAKRNINKNSPALLTGLAVGGLFTSTFMAVRATPKAVRILEEEMKDDSNINNLKVLYMPDIFEYFGTKEIIKLTWKCYIPTALMLGATTACIIGANNVNTKRNAALASMYTLTEKSLKEYQSKVVEVIGENKEQKIRDDIAQDRLNKNPLGYNEVIITGKGDMLCYDSISGRYFKNDIEHIRRLQNDLNHSLLSDMWISLNELYYALGLSGINFGEDVGWHAGQPIDIRFSTMLSDDKVPCLVLTYDTFNRHDVKY